MAENNVKQIGQMDEGKKEKIVVGKRRYKNTRIQVFTITSKYTADNSQKGIKSASKLDYDDLQRIIRAKAHEFLDPTKRHQINVLAPQGWRAGKAFDGLNNMDFYDPEIYYSDKADHIDYVLAIQILEF